MQFGPMPQCDRIACAKRFTPRPRFLGDVSTDVGPLRKRRLQLLVHVLENPVVQCLLVPLPY